MNDWRALRQRNPSKGDLILVTDSASTWPEGPLLTVFDRWRVKGKTDQQGEDIGLIIAPFDCSVPLDNSAHYHSSKTQVILPPTNFAGILLPNVQSFYRYCGHPDPIQKHNVNESARFYFGLSEIADFLESDPKLRLYSQMFRMQINSK